MSIDFSTLKGLTIPEGVVTQITDSNGTVIWKVKKDTVRLKIKASVADIDNPYGHGQPGVFIDENTGYYPEIMGDEEILIDLQPGTSIMLSLPMGDYFLNGEYISHDTTELFYEVLSDTTIVLAINEFGAGQPYIYDGLV